LSGGLYRSSIIAPFWYGNLVVLLFAVIFGFAYGGMVTLTDVGTTEFFGVKSIGTILAVYYYVTGFGSLVGPSMFGFIFDFTGGYRLAFLITIVFCVCAFILSLILLSSEGKEQRNG
jgi:MFS family permease